MNLLLANLKAMVVVLPIAVVVFALAKPICLRFMAPEDFVRRRNVWLVLTVAAFASPSFWMFVAVAIPVLLWAVRKDDNPIALYLLVLYVIPPLGLDIPVVGINNLFKLTSFRLLSFAILIPVALRLLRVRDKSDRVRLTAMDGLLLSYGALHLLLLVPYETVTHTMRRGFLFFVDAYVLFFVVSRTCLDAKRIAEAMAALCLACAVLSPLAVFEWARHWLLYGGMKQLWGDENQFSYLLRGDVLRAQVSVGHSIPLGFLMAIGLGCWFYLRSKIASSGTRFYVDLWICAGLIASFSRAPWLVAAVIWIAYLVLAPKAAANTMKAVAVSIVFAAILFISPLGERLVQLLPFVGTIDQGSITYREQLATLSWQLIKQNPFFGTPFFLIYLEDLRQGQGIIDLMNSYATIAMLYGSVGLLLFVGFFLVGMKNAYGVLKSNLRSNEDIARLAAALVACMFGTLAMMATASFGGSLQQAFYILAGFAGGLTASYGLVRRTEMGMYPVASRSLLKSR